MYSKEKVKGAPSEGVNPEDLTTDVSGGTAEGEVPAEAEVSVASEAESVDPESAGAVGAESSGPGEAGVSAEDLAQEASEAGMGTKGGKQPAQEDLEAEAEAEAEEARQTFFQKLLSPTIELRDAEAKTAADVKMGIFARLLGGTKAAVETAIKKPIIGVPEAIMQMDNIMRHGVRNPDDKWSIRVARVLANFGIGAVATAADVVDVLAEAPAWIIALGLPGPVEEFILGSISFVVEQILDTLVMSTGVNLLTRTLTKGEQEVYASKASVATSMLINTIPWVQDFVNQVNIEAFSRMAMDMPIMGAAYQKLLYDPANRFLDRIVEGGGAAEWIYNLVFGTTVSGSAKAFGEKGKESKKALREFLLGLLKKKKATP